ncbi:MAG: helix-turn-helix transcriptional regulator [Bacteroidia bacterium]|jgi:DNA-binding XRE family transcriptional regulator|nr:helix-turn-helix transcriptional regulator [Bacteroidia bacterium]
MLDDLNKRIIEVMVRKDHTKSSFAKALDVSLPLITHITTGRNKPGVDLIQKIISVFDDISPDWLLLGTGTMFRTQHTAPDLSVEMAKWQSLIEQSLKVKEAQLSVIQYHKILYDELKHLEEMRMILEKANSDSVALTSEWEQLRIGLLSKVIP